MIGDLSEKVIVITGGGRGLGAWMAKGFAKANAKIVVTSNSLEECQEVVDEINQTSGTSIAIKMDVTKLEDIHHALEETLNVFGKVDVLVNNAGLVTRKTALEVDEKFYNQINDVNVKGAFFCSQIFGKQMIQQRKGKIINITSAAGKLIRKGLANPMYNMSKGAVNMMTKALAEEWAKYDIHVNAIGPGYFETGPIKERFKDPKIYETVINSTPLSKVGQPSDIIGIAILLASDYSDFITGQIVYVDGGRTIL